MILLQSAWHVFEFKFILNRRMHLVCLVLLTISIIHYRFAFGSKRVVQTYRTDMYAIIKDWKKDVFRYISFLLLHAYFLVSRLRFWSNFVPSLNQFIIHFLISYLLVESIFLNNSSVLAQSFLYVVFCPDFDRSITRVSNYRPNAGSLFRREVPLKHIIVLFIVNSCVSICQSDRTLSLSLLELAFPFFSLMLGFCPSRCGVCGRFLRWIHKQLKIQWTNKT